MTTTLRILGWKAEGLRCPDHEVDFRQERDSPYPVSLIQMRNGTGKTTTLRLLRAALSGSLEEQRNSDAVGEFRGDGSDMGKFELRLEYSGRPLTLLMEFDFRDAKRPVQDHGARRAEIRFRARANASEVSE